MIDQFRDGATTRLMAFVTPDERVFGLYLLAAAVMGVLSWLYYHFLAAIEARPEGTTKKKLFAYIFDKSVFFHKSAIQDYWYFAANAVIYMGIIAQLLLSTHFFMVLFSGLLNKLFGTPATGFIEVSALTMAVYTLVFALAMDFAVFITHYLQHKIPVLWQFHQVHHSAEVLTPMTIYRMHPVDLFFTGLVGAILVGMAYAGFFYLTQETPTAYEIMGLNIIIFAFYLLGYNLRHSHIWLNYPKWLSGIFISPAQHQIHHSIEPKHWDRNMGLIFSFWDKLFGTLYVPVKYEKLRYGINEKEPNPFHSVWDMYVKPFKNAWALIVPEGSKRGTALTAIVVILISIGVYSGFMSMDRLVKAGMAPLPSVHMEELTWTEIQIAITDKGYDTVIIPTGGTEQNGGHMALGKHNKIVHYTAGQIAQRLGKTFVAPVMPYVPEDVHMDYAGTVSISENTLEAVLREAAESYKKHGIKNIFFIGDSVGNQQPQANVAAALQQEWPDMTVAHIGDYYDNNGQFEWLRDEKGYTKNEIGGHAGIRDTAEMLVVDSGSVRNLPKFVTDRPSGQNGLYKEANRHIGKKMLEMKIDTALKQIRSLIGDRHAVQEMEIVPH